jgi:uncharacterized protein YraI
VAVGTAAVINDEPANLRADASAEPAIVAELSTGTAVTVVGGPVVAGDSTWYQVDTDAGTGWVAGEYLARPGV